MSLSMRRVMLVLSGIVAMRALMMMAAVTYLAVFLTEEGVTEWFAGASITRKRELWSFHTFGEDPRDKVRQRETR